MWVKINPSNLNKYRKIRIMMKKRNTKFKFRESPSGNQFVLGSPNQSKMTRLIIRNQFKVFRQNNHWKKPKLFKQIQLLRIKLRLKLRSKNKRSRKKLP
jgi:hypothetical protein